MLILHLNQEFFQTNEFLMQSEYRKKTKNSSHIIDFSLNNDQSISKIQELIFFQTQI